MAHLLGRRVLGRRLASLGELPLDELTGLLGPIGQADTPEDQRSAELGANVLAERRLRPDLAPHAELPDDTRLWAALQAVCGGTVAGCVYDVDTIIETLEAGKEALRKE